MKYFIYSLLILFFCNCTPDNVTIDNSLEKHFKENNVTGCFAMFNNSSGRFTIYNLERYRDSTFLPASTFKIVNSLIGLQTGVINNDSMIIKWDGIERSNVAWNKDLTMYEAFRVSSVPYYQEVARRIGKETMQLWLDSLQYGNKKIGNAVDSFWLNNTLKVTPDEQLGLVKRLYFSQLPFFGNVQETVKRAMLFEDKPTHSLSYKTGTGTKENGASIAWMVGWIQENNHPYFFVLNFETQNKSADLSGVRMKILKNILSEMGFMQGKK